MVKHFHELRDPIHVFVRYDSTDRKAIDSRPIQRLRYIHQLAMSYLVYPGTTHRRFEHSLGVMELAGRVFEVITNKNNILPQIREAIPEIDQEETWMYWRRVLRMAALFHDSGHLPFSHAAEKELLPEGWDHEQITAKIIFSDEMTKIWEKATPPLRAIDIVKLAIGPKRYRQSPFTNWEAILSEIISGDVFGVDRIDYLLRDSHHAGVAYGKFDHFRLIDTLRILPSQVGPTGTMSAEPALGVEEGGLHSAEALLLARYFMYQQVYFHSVRRVYDIHLKDFLKEWLDEGQFSIDLNRHLSMTDNEVSSAFLSAALDPSKPGHIHARRIAERKHFKLLYQPNPDDRERCLEPGEAVFRKAKEKFGSDMVRRDEYTEAGGTPDFPVLSTDGRIASAFGMSTLLRHLPIASLDFSFIAPERLTEALEWLELDRDDILKESGD